MATALAIMAPRWPEGVMLRRLLAVFVMMTVSLPAHAQLCADGRQPAVAADGRVLGHLPYGDVAPGELVPVPAPWNAGGACLVRRDMLPDLLRLLTAAAGDPAVGGRILTLSCHRSLGYQQSVFCREANSAVDDRAQSVAPPGHSEHATGFALDFAFRPRVNDCPDAEACVAATPAFRWLAANATRFGFEMSFPAGNRQRVKWEPWHWRWVGASGDAPGAGRARAVFARARAAFPANPAVAPDALVIRDVAPPPVYMEAIPPPECRKGKCRVAKAKRK
ncbi:M15 family metallopeptidase [Sphingomonas adhaesiva]|uniref:M15 family metallopeptidase n=1 Tax=Sphingomonas adhaesiva TaxID=28212 RepID=UPI002FFBE658